MEKRYTERKDEGKWREGGKEPCPTPKNIPCDA
jgi:hypothetical protein